MPINVSTSISSLGYGTVGLNLLLALEGAGAEPAFWPLGGGVEAPPEHHAALRRMQERAVFYSPEAPSLRVWHQFDLAQHVGNGPHAAYPFFELDRFRKHEVWHLQAQDVVFASSEWARRVLVDNGVAGGKVALARPGVDPSVFSPSPLPSPEGPTTFINVGKWELRKSHDVICDAFNRAFEKDDEVRLLMHCFNPCFRTQEEVRAYNETWERHYRTSKMRDRITLSRERFATQRDLAALMATAHCGVFPSRGEGWNLEALEMLALGRHVILTDYSAHTEFADAANSLLISVEKTEEAHDGVWFKADQGWDGPAGRWAHLGDEQCDQLVEHMRSVHKKNRQGDLHLNRAGLDCASRFTWGRTAREVLAGVWG